MNKVLLTAIFCMFAVFSVKATSGENLTIDGNHNKVNNKKQYKKQAKSQKNKKSDTSN